ncbi:unnamed protein product [Schistosoma curassoni]|uniref:Uncharacterized protein n=1 Tax=Schistosoma curassoni TaxID=6186 RepID=A0A183JQN2_9TREM|nr:unnamed protein product [Schistosoma curassoni]
MYIYTLNYLSCFIFIILSENYCCKIRFVSIEKQL